MNRIIILKSLLSRLTLFSCVVMLVACSASDNIDQQERLANIKTGQKTSVFLLTFQESEPNIDPYITRMLISSKYMRMDDGKDSDDFTLFDREKRMIYSVTHENQQVLLITDGSTRVTWVNEFTLEEKTSEDSQAPEISGKKPTQVEFLVNGKSCMQIAAVPGLLDEALKAIREFRQVLASEHIRNLGKTPAEMQDPCFLAYEARYPGKILRAGFPIQKLDNAGRVRALLDYTAEYSVNANLFRLPQGYQQFSSSAIQ